MIFLIIILKLHMFAFHLLCSYIFLLGVNCTCSTSVISIKSVAYVTHISPTVPSTMPYKTLMSIHMYKTSLQHATDNFFAILK